MPTKPKTKTQSTKQAAEQSPDGRSLSLYELETELTDAMANWLDADDRATSGDDTGAAGLEAAGELNALRSIVTTYLSAAMDKRDKVARFILHLENQARFAQDEIARLQNRKRVLENAKERLKQYVLAVCEDQGVKKLEGATHTLYTRKIQDSIEIVDEKLVPERHLVPQPPKPDKREIMAEYKLMDEAREKKLEKDPKAEVAWPSVPGTVRHQGRKTVVVK